jgi:hypothetical protein
MELIVAAYHYDLRPRSDRSIHIKKFQSGESRHLDIEQQDVGLPMHTVFQTFFRILEFISNFTAQSFPWNGQAKQFDDPLFVVYNHR